MSEPIPPLHVVTDDDVLARADLVGAAGDVLEAGGGQVALHIRGPRTGVRRIFEFAAALAPLAERCGARLFVNDRVDAVIALRASRGRDVGVHLGRRSLSPSAVRRLRPELTVGASIHAPFPAYDEVDEADFLFVGPVFETPSHPGVRGGGPELVRTAVERFGPRCVGIGGITPARVGSVVRAGGEGVAVITGVWTATDPGSAVRAYLGALERAARAEGRETQADGSTGGRESVRAASTAKEARR